MIVVVEKKKSLKGGKAIGRGTYGCIFWPALFETIHVPKEEANNFVTKIASDAQEEWTLCENIKISLGRSGLNVNQINSIGIFPVDFACYNGEDLKAVEQRLLDMHRSEVSQLTQEQNTEKLEKYQKLYTGCEGIFQEIKKKGKNFCAIQSIKYDYDLLKKLEYMFSTYEICINCPRLLKDARDKLSLLHKAGVYHLDIKPANLGIKKNSNNIEEIYFADWGLCCVTPTAPIGKNELNELESFNNIFETVCNNKAYTEYYFSTLIKKDPIGKEIKRFLHYFYDYFIENRIQNYVFEFIDNITLNFSFAIFFMWISDGQPIKYSEGGEDIYYSNLEHFAQQIWAKGKKTEPNKEIQNLSKQYLYEPFLNLKIKCEQKNKENFDKIWQEEERFYGPENLFPLIIAFQKEKAEETAEEIKKKHFKFNSLNLQANPPSIFSPRPQINEEKRKKARTETSEIEDRKRLLNHFQFNELNLQATHTPKTLLAPKTPPPIFPGFQTPPPQSANKRR